MKKPLKRDSNLLFRTIGQHIIRHNLLIIIFLSIVVLMNVVFTLGWYYSPDDVPQLEETMFYVSQTLLFASTMATIIVLIIARFKKLNDFFIAIANHIYALFLIAWATIALCFDLTLGFSPLVFLLVSTLVAAIFVIDPLFFAICEGLAFIPIIITIINRPDIFFGGKYYGENITLFVAFAVLLIVVCFRNHRVILSEYKIEKKLRDLSYNDELTGLLNERSYIDEVTDIDHRIDKGEDVRFAVILMDVNNLKATNDAYGHRYGCSLVVSVVTPYQHYLHLLSCSISVVMNSLR